MFAGGDFVLDSRALYSDFQHSIHTCDKDKMDMIWNNMFGTGQAF